VSVVIPAYNESARLPPTIARVREYFAQSALSYEVVVVDDGSTDDTAARARACGVPQLTVLVNEPNRGKGYSVRRGMLAARGAHRLMTDADLSTPIDELDRLLAVQRAGTEVVIGSRAVSGSNIEVRQPWYRENMGRLFNLLVRLLAVPGLRDTQCGFKLFTARAAEEVFSRARLDGFSFDVEALFLARRAGFSVAEIPVTWRNDAATRVGMLGGFRAFPDLFRIRTNAWLGRYRA
jgi:dolichyl-phosphate beta-glucosyltransferase